MGASLAARSSEPRASCPRAAPLSRMVISSYLEENFATLGTGSHSLAGPEMTCVQSPPYGGQSLQRHRTLAIEAQAKQAHVTKKIFPIQYATCASQGYHYLTKTTDYGDGPHTPTAYTGIPTFAQVKPSSCTLM